MKLVQFGLPFSPNLGDGLISDCFAHGVGRVRPGARVVAVDLSGRRDFGEAVVANRARALAVLRRLPRPARHALVEVKLGRVLSRALPAWRRALAGADLAVIGGGQLFSDADLNFPTKVAAAARLARQEGVPVAVHAAGVARNWSPRGTTLFEHLYEADLRHVGLRDAPSIDAWRAQTGGRGPAPARSRDPGVLALDCYGPVDADDRVGLCVAAPEILSYHAERGGAGTGAAAGPAFFEDLARALLARGHRLRLFCNGAEEDADALARLSAALCDAGGAVETAPVPDRPEALARLVGGCSAVIAHRLHACIVAVSYGRPVVGLGWDRKVESFFDEVGAPEAFAPAGTPPARIAERAGCAAAPPPALRRRLVEEALHGIRATLDAATAGGDDTARCAAAGAAG